jgi:hypothetical protein
MGNPAEEREVFTGFLAAMPMFAGSPVIDWRQPAQDPPDIEADLADSRKIAVELTSWLDESQIGREKKAEMIEASFCDALKPEPPNNNEHIFLVWLSPNQRMRPADRAAFRTELLALLEAIDKDWKNSPRDSTGRISRSIRRYRSTPAQSTFTRAGKCRLPPCVKAASTGSRSRPGEAPIRPR